jgi:DeoR family fructose operon transcriptional repressor
MPLDQRREQLLDLVRARGFASLPELASELEVSESTVRRDLEHLEDQGNAKRTHGGVFYTGESPQFPHFKDRQVAQWDKKRAIATSAVELIQDGETLLLDGGSTTYEVARLLVGRPLQIVTNSMPVANLFASNADGDLVLIGGNVHLRTGVTLGPYAHAMLSDLNVRRAIMSVAAANEKGYYNSNILQVEIQRAMLNASDEVMVVADSTKFGHSSLSRLCELSEVDRLIVDNGMSKSWRKTISDAGTDLTIAEVTDE